LSRLAKLDFDEREAVLVARVTGELDLSNVHDVGDAIAGAITGEHAGLVLDLTSLTHLDSAGVRMLFDLRARLAAARQRFAVVVGTGALIREVLILAAVPGTIRVHDEVDAAVTDVASG
jgi:anti-sigma B factor antagonist